jgi:hypothetical protein
VIETRTELLHTLFVAAVEGGINYWAQCSDYRWATDESGRKEDFEGFSVLLHPIPGETEWGVFSGDQDKKPVIVNKEVMDRGLTRLGEWAFTDARNCVGAPVLTENTGDFRCWPRRAGEHLAEFMAEVQGEKFDVDFDAAVADVVVQLGLFNEVVYG